MIEQVLLEGYNNPLRIVDGADFDGTNDWMLRGGLLTGLANSKSGIISVWVRLDGGNGGSLRIFDNSNTATVSPFAVDRSVANQFVVQGRNPLFFNLVLNLITTGTYTAGATWQHLLSSWDLAASASSLYINDVLDMGTQTMVNDVIDYVKGGTPEFGIGVRRSADDSKFNGCIAEAYFAPGQYLDFSLVANRRKFISVSGKPTHLGATGSLPTGTAPLVYQHIDNGEAVANFATNRGTGGNFTITGTLDTASTSPSD